MASDRAVREWLIADMDRADPQYQQLAAECGEQSASDLHWYGLAPYSGPQVPQASVTRPAPQCWTDRVHRAKAFIEAWDAEQYVLRLSRSISDEQYQLFWRAMHEPVNTCG